MWRLIVTMIVILLMIYPLRAQERIKWCEVEAPADTGKGFLTVEDVPQIGELVRLPANSRFIFVKVSADGTRAVTAIYDDDTWKQELVGINLVEGKVYFRLTADQMTRLRPPRLPEDDEGVTLKRVDWLGTSNKLALQTDYICHACGEYSPPPDDLHIIYEDGTLVTRLVVGQGGLIDFSPDGMNILLAKLDELVLVKTAASG